MMFERIWKKIIRREPYTLWDIPAFFLWLASFVYRVGFAFWRAIRGKPLKLPLPVISVGNLTVGGSGKTPLVACVGRFLLNDGIRVGVVSSGYGRPDQSPFVAPGYKVQSMEVEATGDEIMLLATSLSEAVFSVAPSKTKAAQSLVQSGKADVIIIDDGLQHIALARDIDLVAYDAGVKRRHLKAFPYGVLREPLKALRRVDIIIVTRAKFAQDINAIKRRLRKLSPTAEIYHASFVAEYLIGHERTLPVKYLEDKSVLLFAGVGNFEALKRQVSALSGDLDYALELADHQLYDQALVERIMKLADRHDSDLILTTQKDWVKVQGFDLCREFYYLDLSVDLDPGEEKLLAYLKTNLGLSDRRI